MSKIIARQGPFQNVEMGVGKDLIFLSKEQHLIFQKIFLKFPACWNIHTQDRWFMRKRRLSPPSFLQIWVMVEVNHPRKTLPSEIWVYPSPWEQEEGTERQRETLDKADFRNEMKQAKKTKYWRSCWWILTRQSSSWQEQAQRRINKTQNIHGPFTSLIAHEASLPTKDNDRCKTHAEFCMSVSGACVRDQLPRSSQAGSSMQGQWDWRGNGSRAYGAALKLAFSKTRKLNLHYKSHGCSGERGSSQEWSVSHLVIK